MSKRIFINTIGWGIILWLFGYILGIILFPIVPITYIGWVIMPLGILLTIFVLLKRIKTASYSEYFLIALIWTLIAIAGDYFFLVKLFKPTDGYYKLDVYLYYLLTFLLPLIVGYRKK